MSKSHGAIDVVRGLIGPVTPCGSHQTDTERLENLAELTALLDGMMSVVVHTASFHDDHMASRKALGEQARKFLKEWHESLKDLFDV